MHHTLSKTVPLVLPVSYQNMNTSTQIQTNNPTIRKKDLSATYLDSVINYQL
ncbi:hypothetical protein VIBNISOn1_1390003 [Vibrio nigripulchritudo SOn1]|uniref:Uncharacterized protein n=1 Tax=Vibrio nigripulchritudo SOn1 TaxID=1238450 RepID=A0AAV2VL04_9VIBR|nr:hypothetical protein VIBNISOn1_1390003 [Vibrio nigripulchritudo SOn1]